MSIPNVIDWIYKGTAYASVIEGPCSKCGAFAIIRLPPTIQAEQPDDTTHVCHALAGGCNHGFSDLPEKRAPRRSRRPVTS